MFKGVLPFMYSYWQSYYSPYHNHYLHFDTSVRNYRISKNENFLKGYMRSFWEQHVAWTRLAIISIVFHLPDVNVTVKRLLQNATHMGLSLEPFYGEDAVKKYSALIKDHLVIAADLVKAAKAGDQNAAVAIEKKWYANGDEIVAFLTSINPHIQKEEFTQMFYEHLALTKAEALAFLNKDYEAGVKLYDKVEKEALEMSDMITNAIVKQFPQVFQ